MAAGERAAPDRIDAALHRQLLRIRTVAVSYAAAVSSAHRDMDVPADERDRLIESWRSWSLDAIGSYAGELEALRRAARPEDADALRAIDAELIAAYRTVNGT